MTRAVVAFVLLAISVVSFSAVPTADDPVRAFADSMAQAMKERKDAVLRDNMAPAMIEAYGIEELTASLKPIRDRYGDILAYEVKQATVGTTLAGTRKLRTATLWYSLRTTKFESGPFLKISVAREGERYFLAAYAVIEFVGGKIPPQLQGHAHQLLNNRVQATRETHAPYA